MIMGLVAVAALAVPGAAALAKTVHCHAGQLCGGTDGTATLYGSKTPYPGGDELYGDGGNDTIYAYNGFDALFGDSQLNSNLDGNDQLSGGPGADTFYDGGGSDLIVGGG